MITRRMTHHMQQPIELINTMNYLLEVLVRKNERRNIIFYHY
jgi:hypothetical protein